MLYPSPWWHLRIAFFLFLLVLILSWLEPDHVQMIPWLNAIAVRFGWLITTGLAVIMVMSIKGGRPWWQDSLLLAGGTAWWAAGSHFFRWLATKHGTCTTAPASHQGECNGVWRGFDISGHCFILTMALMIFFEYSWALVKGLGKAKGVRYACCLVILSITAIVASAWLFLLIQTSLFYHTMDEKILGVLLGAAYWTAASFIVDV